MGLNQRHFEPLRINVGSKVNTVQYNNLTGSNFKKACTKVGLGSEAREDRQIIVEGQSRAQM